MKLWHTPKWGIHQNGAYTKMGQQFNSLHYKLWNISIINPVVLGVLHYSWWAPQNKSRVSCQKGPICHALLAGYHRNFHPVVISWIVCPWWRILKHDLFYRLDDSSVSWITNDLDLISNTKYAIGWGILRPSMKIRYPENSFGELPMCIMKHPLDHVSIWDANTASLCLQIMSPCKMMLDQKQTKKFTQRKKPGLV